MVRLQEKAALAPTPPSDSETHWIRMFGVTAVGGS
jgi:hypothetical protein